MNHRRLWSVPLINGHQPRLGPAPPRPLPWRTFSLPNRPQLPPHVVQVQHPGLVDPQPHVGRQPGDRVVYGRPERTCGKRQLLTPPGEQLLDLRLSRSAHAAGDRPQARAGSPHPAGTRSPGRSGYAARSCAAAPGTESTPSSAAAPPGPRRRPGVTQDPAEVGIQRRPAASPTAAARTSPGSAAVGRCHCGSCCRPAPPRHAPAQTRPARRSRNQSEILLAHRRPDDHAGRVQGQSHPRLLNFTRNDESSPQATGLIKAEERSERHAGRPSNSAGLVQADPLGRRHRQIRNPPNVA